MNKIKVVVVDDSALMRKIISDIINAQSDMEVIATARNGEDLLNKIEKNVPNVITLDIEMPKMDGIATLESMKIKKYNIPTIMLSSVSKRGTALTMECLEKGAFDFVAKPSGSISLDIKKVSEELIAKVRVAYAKNINGEYVAPDTKPKVIKKQNNKRVIRKNEKIDAVVIGASTGGPKALYKVITKLPGNLDVPVLVVQHMPVGFTKAFAERLDSNSEIKVVEGEDGQLIEKNKVYIAPGGFHMEVSNNKRIRLTKEPTIWGVRPAVDKLFVSASKIYGKHLLSIVLTGMGKDGAQGTVQVKERGGITISEDKSTCTIYGMPRAAFETGKVDEVLPIDSISDAIIKNIKDGRR